MARTVEFFGDTFELNEALSEWALMEIAEAAEEEAAAGEMTRERAMKSLAATKRLIEACIVDGDLQRFRATARKNRAGMDDLMQVVGQVFEEKTERPTGRPSDSSDGPPTTGPRSVSSSADRGLERLSGRPDLQLAVVRQRAS